MQRDPDGGGGFEAMPANDDLNDNYHCPDGVFCSLVLHGWGGGSSSSGKHEFWQLFPPPGACFSGSCGGGRFIQPPVSANYFWPPVVQHIQSPPGQPPCCAALQVPPSLPNLFSLEEEATPPPGLEYLHNSSLASISFSLCLFLALLFLFSFFLSGAPLQTLS